MNEIFSLRGLVAVVILILNIIVMVTDLVIIRKHLKEQRFLNRVIDFSLEDLKR
ncbi:hypothetical protein [Streptococcus caballi]|uniref:hypothetical protein n=1 Tax=Streptococcus caballi TaxID=439220 RepID=UPI00035D93D0|nr:hypothetical protein [Streptococcus caballi]